MPVRSKQKKNFDLTQQSQDDVPFQYMHSEIRRPFEAVHLPWKATRKQWTPCQPCNEKRRGELATWSTPDWRRTTRDAESARIVGSVHVLLRCVFKGPRHTLGLVPRQAHDDKQVIWWKTPQHLCITVRLRVHSLTSKAEKYPKKRTTNHHKPQTKCTNSSCKKEEPGLVTGSQSQEPHCQLCQLGRSSLWLLCMALTWELAPPPVQVDLSSLWEKSEEKYREAKLKKKYRDSEKFWSQSLFFPTCLEIKVRREGCGSPLHSSQDCHDDLGHSSYSARPRFGRHLGHSAQASQVTQVTQVTSAKSDLRHRDATPSCRHHIGCGVQCHHSHHLQILRWSM